MIRLYQARENIDKERFIYENIKGEALVIVPNQYTLVAEEQALKYLNRDCLFDVEIISMNRLGLRVLTEQGLESVKMLDKYGRFMLLNTIIKNHRDELDLYAKSANKISFTQMLNDFISDFKQQNCSIEEIKELLTGDSADELLKSKLSELENIIEEYEHSIEGKYTDSEDYIAMYVNAIKESRMVLNKDIWIYGYDSITPKFMNAMFELAARANSLNFVVNSSDFTIDENLVRQLVKEADIRDIELISESVSDEYALEKSETIARIERGLWNDALSGEERTANAGFVPEDLTLVRAANPYYEAESAAAYIWHLVRDRGYRMRDIQIIANDEGVMQPIIDRTLEEYGLPVFLDKSRSISDAAAVSFIVNQLYFTRYKDGTKYLLAMLKTGMAGIDYDDVEMLENYVRKYKIKGSMWMRPFKYGAEEYGDERFAQLESIRQSVAEAMAELKTLSSEGTIEEFVATFRTFLEDRWQLRARVEALADEQVELGLIDEAQRDVQSYASALSLLDQIVEIMGDEPMNLDEFTDIYTTGLANVEVGVIPPTIDGMSVGTMIRTRPRPAKAVVVLGANEGTLPLQPSDDGLFSVDEKKYFKEKGFALGGLDELKMDEENVAMYRMLSKPSECLYISWSMTDADGKEAIASPLIDELIELFPRIKKDGLIKRDIISAGWNPDSNSKIAVASLSDDGAIESDRAEVTSGIELLNKQINTPSESMRHLINHLKNRNTAREMDAQTQALLSWFEKNDKSMLDTMLRAAQDENNPQALGKTVSTRLYAGKTGAYSLSASALDNYFNCPFKYFVDKGLKPEEEREFSGDARSIGDIYHECLMRVADKILADKSYGAYISDCDDAELERIVSRELDEIAGEYNGGLFVSCANEEFHMDRIKEICAAAVRALAEQLGAVSLEDAKFEEGFGRGRKFKPIEFDIDGTKVYVEGKIDRADILVPIINNDVTVDTADGNTDSDVNSDSVGDTNATAVSGERVRIIDYKTGNDKLDIGKMRNGYKMQLMIYMMSAMGNYEPAGMFYFNIKDQIMKYDGKDETHDRQGGNVMNELKAADLFKLRGVYVDEPGVLDSMPAEVLGSTKGKLSREEFERLKDDVSENIEKLASGIVEGKIDIRPFKNNGRLACSFCEYSAICKRDREYMLNAAREI